MEELRLSLKGKEIKVVLETVEGSEDTFTLRELTGKTRDDYLTSNAARMRFNEDGKVTGVKSFDGLQSSLLSRCMFTETGDLVSAKIIQGFPASAVTALFEKAQELNALDVKGDEAAKKE
jgi:hypothetical protein